MFHSLLAPLLASYATAAREVGGGPGVLTMLLQLAIVAAATAGALALGSRRRR